MTETTKSQKPRGSSLLRDLLASRNLMDVDRQQLESDLTLLNERVKQQHQRINETTAVMREAVQTELETLVGEIIDLEPQWNVQGIVVQCIGMSEEWWKVFFLQTDGKFVQVDPQKLPPGFFWSYDPERKLKGTRSADDRGAFVRWGEFLPALDASKGLLGTALVNPLTGEIKVTLTEPMELKVIENAGPDAGPGPAPTAPAPVEGTPPGPGPEVAAPAAEAAPAEAVATA